MDNTSDQPYTAVFKPKKIEEYSNKDVINAIYGSVVEVKRFDYDLNLAEIKVGLLNLWVKASDITPTIPHKA